MRVFVTGASGYIGSSVCGAVKKRGHDVVGLARSNEAADKLLARGIHPVQGTLSDHNVLREMTHDADAVVHCAFDMRSNDGIDVEARALDVMLAAVDSSHEAFIYTSGCWVYGDTGAKPVDETAPLHPPPIVAWRPAHERMVHNARKHKLRTIVIRPGLVYGDGGGIVGMMIGQAKSAQLAIAGKGENHWTTVRVDALAELYALALERAPAGAFYNGVNGDPVTYGDIARAASRAAGKDGRVEAIPLEQARKTMGPLADALALDQRLLAARAQIELDWDPDRPTVLEELSNTTVV
jgi:nucleoside-diphosphate-sugar epimerase